MKILELNHDYVVAKLICHEGRLFRLITPQSIMPLFCVPFLLLVCLLLALQVLSQRIQEGYSEEPAQVQRKQSSGGETKSSHGFLRMQRVGKMPSALEGMRKASVP